MSRTARWTYMMGAGMASLALVAGNAAAQGTLGPPSGPMSILYTEQDDVAQLTDAAGPGPALIGDRGVFRQDPGYGGMLDPHGRDADFRIGKLSDHDLEDLTPEEMAELIIDRSDNPEVPNTTGIVAIDEVGNSFNDGRVKMGYKWVTVRGKRYRIAAHNDIKITKNGWKLIRRPSSKVPEVDPDSLGSRFSRAMVILSRTPHPAGGTYADRVHLYIAPAFGSSIGVGRGPHRHLGPDGKPHRATWRGVMPAVARAGGVWLQMYHYDGGSTKTMSAKLWRKVPAAFYGYAKRFRTDLDRIHFVFSGATNVPRGAKGCGNAMACQWDLARSTRVGRAILSNGVAAYRTAELTATWRQEFNRTFS